MGRYNLLYSDMFHDGVFQEFFVVTVVDFLTLKTASSSNSYQGPLTEKKKDHYIK